MIANTYMIYNWNVYSLAWQFNCCSRPCWTSPSGQLHSVWPCWQTGYWLIISSTTLLCNFRLPRVNHGIIQQFCTSSTQIICPLKSSTTLRSIYGRYKVIRGTISNIVTCTITRANIIYRFMRLHLARI